ncbi:TPA: PAS domain S-box protein, partial [bacterium]|nr:PAS domain S-box protein [bacterium]
MDKENNLFNYDLSELADKITQLKDENRKLRSELLKNNEKYQKGLDVNKALSEIFNILISSESLDEIAKAILDQARKLTSSKHGYVSSVCPETGDLISHTLTEMMDNCNISEKKTRFPRGDNGLYNGLWGYSLNTVEAFFTNKPDTHPASKGLPDGHVPLERFLSVPVLLDGKVVGQIALGNSDRDYTDMDIYIIKRLSNYYALAIQKYNMEEELKKSETRYRNIIAQADGVAYQRDWIKNCFVFIDDGIEKITGYSPKEMTTDLFDSLIIEEKLYTKRNIPIRSDMSRKISGENATVYYADYILQKRDGQKIWITDYSIQNRNTNGELIGTLGMLQDITKRVEAEEEVGLLAKLLDYAPASIVVHDFNGNFLYANQKTFEIHDYTKDEFMAKNLHEIDLPESEKLINERMRIIEKNGEASFRVWHYKKDGSIIPMDIYVKMVEWKNQKAIMSIGTDVSDKLQAENALRESEERYRRIVETTREGIWVMNQKFETTFVNQAMADMLGYNIDEILGKIVTDFMFEEDLDEHSKQMENRKQGKDGYYERRFRRKDGNACWTIVSAKPLMLETGEFGGSFGMFTDITERKYAEELLHEKEHEFRTLVENVPGAVYRCEINKPYMMLYMSDGIQEISGRPPSEFISGITRFVDIIHFEDAQKINKIINECVSKKFPYEIEYRIYRPDGSIKWVSDHGRAIYNDNGEPKYLDGVIIDIDAQKQADEIKARLQ